MLQKIFMKIYPILYALINIAQVFMKFRYLVNDKSQFYDLLYWICKVKGAYKNV